MRKINLGAGLHKIIGRESSPQIENMIATVDSIQLFTDRGTHISSRLDGMYCTKEIEMESKDCISDLIPSFIHSFVSE